MRAVTKILGLILVWAFALASVPPLAAQTQMDRISVTAINNVVYCDRQAGVDASTKMTACIAALPTTGGTADALSLTGAQTISSTVTVGSSAKHVKLILGNATYTGGTAANPMFSVALGSGIEMSPGTVLAPSGTNIAVSNNAGYLFDRSTGTASAPEAVRTFEYPNFLLNVQDASPHQASTNPDIQADTGLLPILRIDVTATGTGDPVPYYGSLFLNGPANSAQDSSNSAASVFAIHSKTSDSHSGIWGNNVVVAADSPNTACGGGSCDISMFGYEANMFNNRADSGSIPHPPAGGGGLTTRMKTAFAATNSGTQNLTVAYLMSSGASKLFHTGLWCQSPIDECVMVSGAPTDGIYLDAQGSAGLSTPKNSNTIRFVGSQFSSGSGGAWFPDWFIQVQPNTGSLTGHNLVFSAANPAGSGARNTVKFDANANVSANTALFSGNQLSFSNGSTYTTVTIFPTPGGANATLTFPATTDTIVGRGTTDTLTNKTLASPAVTGNMTYASTAPVANLNASLASYNAAGTQQANTHGVFGACTLGTNCAITLSGSAAYTSASSYSCVGTDATAANGVKVAQASGSSVTFTGTGTDVINYVCLGN